MGGSDNRGWIADLRTKIGVLERDLDQMRSERDAAARRALSLTAALDRMTRFTPQTYENDGAAYNSGVLETAQRYKQLARDALKGADDG